MKENNNLKYIILPVSAKKKKIIMEWDKQWKLHCNSDRFIDNLVWGNQLYIWYCIINLRGRDTKYVAIYPIHKLDTFSFVFFFQNIYHQHQQIDRILKLQTRFRYYNLPQSSGNQIPLKNDNEFFKCWRKVENWNRLKSTHSGSDYVCGSSILYCVRYL